MNGFDPAQGAQAVYNFWLSLIPQFMGQLGAPPGAMPQAPPRMPWMNALLFPVDQIAKATQMTQQSLQTVAQAMAPMMEAGAMPNMLAQWAAALTRASRSHRKAVQKVADILADMLDLATRRDLDEAFREIQALKRELRNVRRQGAAA